MIARCHNKRSKGFKNYGARGISVFSEWRGQDGFKKFLAYCGKRPSDDHSIERVNNDGDYEPGNVCWATRVEQGQNKRNSVKITFENRTQTVAAWARETGIDAATLYIRVARGWDPSRVLKAVAREPARRVA